MSVLPALLPDAVDLDLVCDLAKDAGYFYKENTSKSPGTRFLFLFVFLFSLLMKIDDSI